MKGFTGKLVGSLYPITEEECKQIHKSAVRVLEEGGMRCDDERAAKMFERAGCKIEQDGKLIKFSEKIIMEAFDKCPSNFKLHGRHDPELDINIGHDEVHFATVTGRYIEDFRTGERRQATRQDAIEGTRIADALENVHGLYKSVMWIYDEPKICNSQILVAEQMKNTNKTSTWVYNTGADHEIPDLIKIWGIAAGGAEALKERPH
ncbi:MAG TPA: trimethylamine methyltransferase family protein, partial [Desulfobacterales bacterium]|nr:trimethylamine methyltransferase family protein [Desulfobacterales bacterium]